MKAVLKNQNGYYVKVNVNNGIEKTLDIIQATIFTSMSDIEKYKQKAPSKLKSYKVFSLEDNEPIKIQPVKKIKRKTFDKTTRQSIYNNSGCRCQICGRLITYNDFTIDHIIPLAKGGTNDMSNLQSSCVRCNRIKADVLPDDFNSLVEQIILYRMSNHCNKSFAKSIIKIYLKNIFKK